MLDTPFAVIIYCYNATADPPGQPAKAKTKPALIPVGCRAACYVMPFHKLSFVISINESMRI